MIARLLRRFRRGPGGERTPARATNTQFVVQLSGYAWAADRFALSGRRVLDVACGEGFGAKLMAERGARVTGVDLSEEAVARARALTAGLPVDIRRADGLRLPFPDAAFDAVFSQDTLEHVADDAGFLGELHRVLVPGGRLVLMTPRAPAHTERPENPFHVREYDRASLAARLAPRFTALEWYGRRPAPALEAREASMDRFRRWDPLGLRRWIIPTALRHALGGLVSRGRLDRAGTGEIEYTPGDAGGTLIVTGVK